MSVNIMSLDDRQARESGLLTKDAGFLLSEVSHGVHLSAVSDISTPL